MKTFILLLHVWNVSDETSTFVIDYNLTTEDCILAMNEWNMTMDQYSYVECVAES